MVWVQATGWTWLEKEIISTSCPLTCCVHTVADEVHLLACSSDLHQWNKLTRISMKPLQMIFVLEQVGIMPVECNIKNLNNPLY